MKLHHRSQSRAGTGKGCAEGITTTSMVGLDLSPRGCKHLGSGAEQLCGAYVSVHPASVTVGAHVMLSSQCAVGHEYIADVGKHSSQTDAAQGFGGKYGVQRDRADKVCWTGQLKYVLAAGAQCCA